jgi:hypothetical protein
MTDRETGGAAHDWHFGDSCVLGQQAAEGVRLCFRRDSSVLISLAIAIA